MIKNKNIISLNNIIRVFCVIITTIMVILFAIISITMNSIPSIDDSPIVQNGKSGSDSIHPFYLQGEWSYYKDIFFTPENFDETLLVGDELVTLPYSKLTEAKGTATYKLDLKFENNRDLLVYIPYLRNEITVFLNGESLAPVSILDASIGTGIGMFRLSNYDENSEYQQLVISANQNPEDSAFYKRYIILSSLEDINTLILSTSINQFIFFAVLFIIALNGFIFMFLHPSHKIISTITVFDFLLLSTVIMSFPAVLGLYANLSPAFVLQDSTTMGMQVSLLMLTGALGIFLSKEIFDPNFKINKMLWYNGCIGLYLFLAFIFFWDITYYDKYGIQAIIFTLTLTFIGVLKRFLVYYKQYGWTGYFIFQSIKTLFIGVIVLLNIIMLNQPIYNDLTVYSLYLIFLALHLAVRLYDNYVSYREVIKLNLGFESIIVERTQSLLDSNIALQKSYDILNEISIRDVLTKVFNRLHFERKVEELLNKFGTDIKTLYLCILDLDFFKQVNDTYGHDQGDKVLIEIARMTSEILPEDCVFARIGGEEFAIIFMNMDNNTVLSIIENIRAEFEKKSKIDKYAVTGSFGISKYEKGMNSKEWFIRADKALYEAKANGRNRVVYNFEGNNLHVTKPSPS